MYTIFISEQFLQDSDHWICHMLIQDDKNNQEILQQAINQIKDTFKIRHTLHPN